jgi:hypothetical protein
LEQSQDELQRDAEAASTVSPQNAAQKNKIAQENNYQYSII